MDLLSVAMDNLATIRHQALRLGAPSHEVDDWCQEVLLHVWALDQRRVVKTLEDPRSFVLRISRNRMIDILRTSPHRRWEQPADDELGPFPLHLHTQPSAQPETMLVERERMAEVWDVLRCVAGGSMLIDRHRGLRYDELATRYNLPLGTVKSRLNYAKTTVKRVLTGQGYLRHDTPEQKRQRKRAAAQ